MQIWVVVLSCGRQKGIVLTVVSSSTHGNPDRFGIKPYGMYLKNMLARWAVEGKPGKGTKCAKQGFGYIVT